ncbi:MAG: adenosylhomocysteinase [Oscillospiraceae bacterium]|jgi:adenosylhomocysteinase|nr:adenosylhomocysteinase [Oscillospiraceae bacterium]
MSDIRNPALYESGERKIQWAARNMPLLAAISAEFEKTQPFRGVKIALSVHMEAKTAQLCRVLARGGAEMHVTGCNPLSTQDDVAAALAHGSATDAPLDVYAYHAATPEEYERHLIAVLETAPNIVIDDGGDLVNLLHRKLTHLLPQVFGGCEETTTGVMRLHAMAADGTLKYPVIAVNNAKCKYLFDNRYGTGQSVWDGINRTTNLIVAGKIVVVAGYGWCGRGIALRARGFGARVIVTEIDPVRALEARMDGYDVVPMTAAAPLGDIFVTATGCRDVITVEHFDLLKDGAVLCNAGHFNVEIAMDVLEGYAESKYEARQNIVGYNLKNGNTIFILAEGRLVNLASGDGHPAEIMDMSFAIQALSARYLLENRADLTAGVHDVPEAIDEKVARMKLAASGLAIDALTPEQEKYLHSWA